MAHLTYLISYCPYPEANCDYVYDVQSGQYYGVNGRYFLYKADGFWMVSSTQTAFCRGAADTKRPNIVPSVGWQYWKKNEKRWAPASKMQVDIIPAPDNVRPITGSQYKSVPGEVIWNAVRTGNKPLLLELLKRANDVDLQFEAKYLYGGYLMTALMLAAYAGDVELVSMLLKAGANANQQDSEPGLTALMWASVKGHTAAAQVLLQFEADVNPQSRDGRTALMWAAQYGHVEIVRVLLDWGADKNLRNKDGNTAADLAKTEEIRTLINTHGSTPDAISPTQGILSWIFGGNKEKEAIHDSPKPAAAATTGSTTTASTATTATIPPPTALTSGKTLSPSAAPPPPVREETRQPSSPKSSEAGTPAPTLIPSTSDPASASTAAAPSATADSDCQALVVFLQTAPRLEQALLTVAAHDRALQVLVSKEKECPSLFWFYPKKPELRRWLSDPAKCLFQDSLMMVVVCPVTLCVVPCGPDGVGWEVSKPKKWVKEWGPAILFSIYVLQAAVVAGRVVGIPIPPVPGASEVKEALGLKGMLGTAFQKGGNQVNLSDSLNAFADTTKIALDLNPELQALCEGLRAPRAAAADQALPAHLPMRLVGAAYKSIHTFLTTGENAKMGKLEDQLRGRMKRVMAPDGDIEWVSVEGKSAWLQKHSAVVRSMPQQQHEQPTLKPSAFAAPSQPSTPTPSATTKSWLAVRLMARGVDDHKLLARLEEILVSQSGEGFTTVESFATLAVEDFHLQYLSGLGITARGTANHLVTLHRELHAQYQLPSTAGSATATATMSEAEKDELLSNVSAMKKELDKLRAATASTSTSTVAAQKAPGGQGGRGGLTQQQVQCNIRNPRTNQPYTMDELAAELLRHEGLIAQCEEGVAGATAAVERFGELNDHAPPPPRASSARPASEEAEKKRLLFGK